MPTIAIVRDSKLKINYGFVFIIKTVEQLMDWWDKVRTKNAACEFQDAYKSIAENRHATEGVYLKNLAQMKGIGLVEALTELNCAGLQGMYNCLSDYGTIAINSKGGYFPLRASNNISYEQDVRDYVLPGSEIKIMKWTGGTHWYAKVGSVDVIWNGKDKWPTRKTAELAAKKFKKTLEIR